MNITELKAKSKDFMLNATVNSSLFFLYGDNIGAMNGINNFIKKSIKANNLNLGLTQVFTENDPIEAVKGAILSNDMFCDRKIIKIIDPDLKKLGKLFKDIDSKNYNVENYVIINISKSVDASNSVRKLFQNKTEKYFSIGCYNDDIRSTQKIVVDFCKVNNFSISDDNLNFIVSSFADNDRLFLSNELLNLKNYLISLNVKEINEEIINQVVDEYFINDKISLFDVNDYFFEKRLTKFLDKVSNMVDFSPIQCIRYMQIHANLLKNMLFNIEYQHSNIQSEIKKNFVFFKRIPNFQKQLSMYSTMSIENMIMFLVDLELKAKFLSESNVISAMCRFIVSK